MIRTGLFVILGHFLPFYPPNNLENQNSEKNRKNIWTCHHFTHLYQKSWSYNLCFMRYRMWQTTFLSFWAIFCFYTLLMTQKIKTWEKKKKKKKHLKILSFMCTINEDHMMYGSSNIRYDGQNFLPFWPFFALLPL